jgi:hypothetical protein
MRASAGLTIMAVACLFGGGRPAFGQDPVQEEEDALRVFLDCQHQACDFDHLRRELPYVNYVRDREDAEVHVLVTTQPTGSGTEFAITFIGRERFAGSEDVVPHVASDTDTPDEVRDGVVRTLGMAILRYVAETPLADRVQVFYAGPRRGALGGEQPDDPWNFWVFRFGLNGSAAGERSTNSFSLNGDIAASRTTDDWKLNVVLSGGVSESNFELSETETVTSTRKQFDNRVLLVKSLGDHWSAGARASVSASTFFNQDFTVRFAPALEYSLFPYSESTRRQLRFLYTIGVKAFNYEEQTIFNETAETRLDHSLVVTLDLVEEWGLATVSLDGRHFLHDFSKNRVGLTGNIDLRLFRGLSLSVFGAVTHIADQINLPAGGVTDEEILLRERELATSFQYFVSLGVSYTFGSIFSNVVNPRFGG